MDIKPANQKKKLVYPLAAAAVVGSAVLSSCDQQQQQRLPGVEPPQPIGGIIGREPNQKESLPSERKSPQVLSGVIMLEPAKGDAPVKADK